MPLNEDNYHILNEEAFSKMKKGAMIVNTVRGALVDEVALAKALRCGHLYGSGLDVLEIEPPSLSNPLLACDHCLITPHLAWAPKRLEHA